MCREVQERLQRHLEFLAADSRNFNLLAERVDLALQAGRHAEAVDLIERGLALKPEDPLAARYTWPAWKAIPRSPRSQPRPSQLMAGSFQSIICRHDRCSRSTRYTPPWLSPCCDARITELATTVGSLAMPNRQTTDARSAVDAQLRPRDHR